MWKLLLHKSRNPRVILVFVALSIFKSCIGYEDANLINFPFNQIDDVALTDIRDKMVLTQVSSPMSEVVFLDSIVVSAARESDQYLLKVSVTQNDSLIGLFCQLGKAGNEFIAAMPVVDYLRDEEDLKGWFYAYYDEPRFFLWDVSESLRQKKTVYERIVPIVLEDESEERLSAFSYYYLSGDKMFLFNSRQSGYKDWMIEPSTYELFDLRSGKREVIYHPFNLFEEEQGKKTVLRSKTFLSLKDCIDPNREKVAFAMMFIPYLGVINPRTGETKGVRLKGYPGLNLDKRYYHFFDIQCDDKYIYALYAGAEEEVVGDNPNAKLMVFSWGLDLVAEYSIGSITGISLDGDRLYLFNQKYSNYYRISLEELGLI